MAWRWTARRLIISAFVLFHLVGADRLDDAPLLTSRNTSRPTTGTTYCHWACGNGGRSSHPTRCATRRCWTPRWSMPRGCVTFSSSPDRRLALVAEDRSVPPPQVHGQHGRIEYLEHRKFTARSRGPAVGLEAEAFPLWVSLYYQVKESPRARDGRFGPDGPAANPGAGSLPVRLAEGGAAMNPVQGLESIPVRADLGAAAGCVPDRLRPAAS